MRKFIVIFLLLPLVSLQSYGVNLENNFSISQVSLASPDFGSRRGEVVRACSDVYTFSSDVQYCISVVQDARAAYACEDTFSFSDVKTCLRIARSGHVVWTCADEFLGDESALKCVSSARDAGHVLACTDAFIASYDQLKCLRAGVRGF